VRFVISGEWDRNQLLRLILFFFLVYILLFWITNWILYFQKMSLDPTSVVTYFRGDPATEFGQPPRPLGALTEVSHFHLFAMGMLVMTLTHLLLFLPVPFRVKGSLTLLTFLAALLNEGCNWLVRFVHPGFAWLKIFSFLILQIALFGLLMALMMGVLRPRRNAYADHDSQSRGATNGRNSS
jgi:hypothetical protein